jgi:hypothetical protein
MLAQPWMVGLHGGSASADLLVWQIICVPLPAAKGSCCHCECAIGRFKSTCSQCLGAVRAPLVIAQQHRFEASVCAHHLPTGRLSPEGTCHSLWLNALCWLHAEPLPLMAW